MAWSVFEHNQLQLGEHVEISFVATALRGLWQTREAQLRKSGSTDPRVSCPPLVWLVFSPMFGSGLGALSFQS